MAISGSFHYSTTPQVLTVLFMVAALVLLAGGVQGQHPGNGNGCSLFSCGHLRNVSSPFRRRGDPPWCGSQSYELACTDTEAAIRINNATYHVARINQSGSSFWVVDPYLGNSSCPLPRRNQHPYIYGLRSGDNGQDTLLYPYAGSWATFVNCSRLIKNNGMYKPVTCQSTKSSLVYVLTSSNSHWVGYLEPSCQYLAMIPLGSRYMMVPDNASYAYVAKLMKKGFVVSFPLEYIPWTYSWIINTCLDDSMSYFHEQMSSSSIQNRTSAVVGIDMHFLRCVNDYSYRTKLFWAALVVVSAIYILKVIIVLAILSRFVFAPLAVLTFLAYKYWKTKICIDAVEKFLRMQLALGPTRYAYTDIIAITNHFRDKLGQGGYGSVYKGVLPGDVRVAIKMLGTSVCNGDEFISEVSTIGRIHHVNVVRLVGFCSEEMRRAIVYEYMPRGSLDKYIFSAQKSFSWDKLNEIALGIARGINYLHQGCDMQILHFDIKPHNILLDDNFVPKVADFGLAKLYPRDNSFVPLSALRGTVGYIAPEMISRGFGVISSKSDVYSFGMLLLEMAGGRRNADPNAAYSSQAYYPSWVYSRLARRDMGEIADGVVDMHELERKLCVVGLRCIQMKSHDRPMMSEVIEMLEGGADGLQVPPKPFFCEDEQLPAVETIHFSSELTMISEEDE